jgi:hypothetical protein
MPNPHDRPADGDATLLKELARLESCLATPLVPGELVTWFSAVEETFADLKPLLRRQTRERHRTQYEQIMRDDPALQRSVEHLKEEDDVLVDMLERLESAASDFVAKAADIEPDEGLMRPEWERFVDEGLWFVIRVRKQDTAIRTWLGEAMNRERGTGD